jgi:hypothetical protein
MLLQIFNHFLDTESVSLHKNPSFNDKLVLAIHCEIKGSVSCAGKVVDKVIAVYHILSKMVLFE